MFNQINVKLDAIEFEYIDGGHLVTTTVGKPDGISYSQWQGLWIGFKELHDSGKDIFDLIDERVDNSEIDAVEKRNTELENEVNDLENDVARLEAQIDALESENADLEDKIEELKAEIRELTAEVERSYDRGVLAGRVE